MLHLKSRCVLAHWRYVDEEPVFDHRVLPDRTASKYPRVSFIPFEPRHFVLSRSIVRLGSIPPVADHPRIQYQTFSVSFRIYNSNTIPDVATLENNDYGFEGIGLILALWQFERVRFGVQLV